jgi:hypothetical protein
MGHRPDPAGVAFEFRPVQSAGGIGKVGLGMRIHAGGDYEREVRLERGN